MGRHIGERVDKIERAAAQGRVEAQYDLGLIYATGHGVQQDYVTAHKWFSLAAVQGYGEARVHRVELARDMSQSQVARAQRLAREWMLSR